VKKIFIKKSLTAGVYVAIAAAIIGGTFYFGYKSGYKNGEENPQTTIIRGIANMENGKPEGVDFSLFWDAWSKVKKEYVNNKNINDQDLVYGAITGMVGSLKDQNSVFFAPSDATKFTQDLAGQFSGIGARLDVKDNQLIITSTIKDSPAERIGLKAGDKITQIDSKDTAGLQVEDAVKLIRGEKNTGVKLTIMREGFSAPKDFSVIRDTIQVPTVESKMIGNIAYIHLYAFTEQSPFLFYQNALQMATQNPKGLVLDLRDNPGGFLEAAVNLSGWFLDSGKPVVTEEFGNGDKQAYTSYGNGLFRDLPVVVLINGGSASASEILTGALRDDRGVKTVGEKSFGKGTVQQLENLKDGSMLKITVAHWRMPKGDLIDKNGIDPNYEVKISDQDILNGRDPQLDKALEVIKQEIGQMPSNLIPILNIKI